MEDFRRKVFLVVGGSATQMLDVITYSSIVTTDTTCIALAMAALHDLDVKEAEVLRIYMMTPNGKKIWTVLSPDLGTILVSQPL